MYGAVVKRCSVEGCKKQSIKKGICVLHGAVVKRCSVEGCKKGSVKNGVCDAHRARESDPLFKTTFTICSYQTKQKYDLNYHIKIHSDQYIKQSKLEEVKIEKIFLNNKINYTQEHTITYSCMQDIENRNSRIDLLSSTQIS